MSRLYFLTHARQTFAEPYAAMISPAQAVPPFKTPRQCGSIQGTEVRTTRCHCHRTLRKPGARSIEGPTALPYGPVSDGRSGVSAESGVPATMRGLSFDGSVA